MIKLNRLLLILIFINILIFNILSAENTIKSASEYDYPPLAIVTNGQADGFSVDLLRAALNAVEMDVSYYVGAWSEIKMDLAEGRIDALPLVGRTPERETLYDFTVPYLTMYGAIFVEEGNSKITSLKDLTDKKIVVMKGDNAEEFVRREHISKYITTTTTIEEAFKLVSTGKNYAVITQKLIGMQLLKNSGIENVIPIADIKTFKQDFTFAVKQGNKELLTQLNDGLSRIIIDGSYYEIYNKWFGSLVSDELNKVKLTLKEKDFIKAHPIITFGTDYRWEPYVIKKADNTLEGFDVDLINYINEQTGTNIQMETGRWSEMVEQAKELKIDGLTTSSIVEERELFFNFSEPYVTLFPVFVIVGNNDSMIDGIDDFAGKSVAILKGNQFYINLLKKYPEVNIIESVSEMNAIKLTIEGKADAAIVATTSYNNYHKIFSTNIKIGYVATQNPLNLVYSVRKDWPELTSIINKALASHSMEAKNHLIFQWFGYNPIEVGIGNKEELITLTAYEKAWISEHPEISLGVDPAWQPFDYINDKGQHQGIASDYIRILNKRLGINMKVIPNMSWMQLMEAMPERDVDAFSSVVKTPEREEYLSHTEPYLYLDWVVVRPYKTAKIKSLKDFEGRIVAVVDGYTTKDFIKKQYPKIHILPKKTTHDVLQSVIDGKADAALVERVTATMIMHSYRMYSLEIDQHVIQNDKPLSLAVRNDWPELVKILNKGLSSITPEEREMIEKKWLAVPIQIGFTRKDVLRIVLYVIAAMGLFIVLFFFWNRSLKMEILKRNKAEALILKNKNRLDYALNSIQMGAWELDLQTMQSWRSFKHDHIFGYDKPLLEWTYEMFLEHIVQEDKEMVDRKFKYAISTKTDWNFECKIERKNDKRVRWIWAKGLQEFSEENKYGKMFGIVQDITEKKLIENDVIEKTNELERHYKVSEKQRIANLMILKDLTRSTKELKFEIKERKNTEKLLHQRMEELEIFNEAAVDREFMINDHRKEINELLLKLGKEAEYEIVE